ncbi:MAG: hypothetical protein CVV28_04350 [Methanobacteriales archaeon HGW-Methanobacteriales-1]|jgi:hypothetical protein|nr:MAG: hypothetical protein CVV28_04350 [Methanobacteriales archaeon HGW-Methanobacteriales-1]
MPESDKIAYVSAAAGIIIIIYPYLGQVNLSKISGLILLGLCLLIFFSEFKDTNFEKISNERIKMVWLAIFAISLILGISLIYQIYVIEIWLLIAGILLGASGYLIFKSRYSNKYQNDLRNILLVLGLIYILMGLGVINPMYLGIFIGLALIYYAYQRQR